jgi:hypothetical protein
MHIITPSSVVAIWILGAVCSFACREALGYSEKVWKNMTKTLMAGNDQLIQNKHHLLPKIWDLILLARNLLAAKEKAQNLAAYG